MGPKQITAIPIGTVPEIVPKVVAAHIEGYLNLGVTILPPVSHPAYAYNALRSQYDAAKIIGNLEARCRKAEFKTIGIVNLDLFVPLFTHCLGQARQDGCCAVISLYRLGDKNTGSAALAPVVLERAAKVALHELGHLFTLLHCDDPRCLMHYSAAAEDLDTIGFQFCRYCRRFVEDAIHHWQQAGA